MNIRSFATLCWMALPLFALPACDAAGTGHPMTPAVPNAPKPRLLQAFEDLRLYAADSPLNVTIPTDAKIDPQSDKYVALLLKDAASGGFQIEVGQYSAPVYFAETGTPKVDVKIACGDDWGGGLSWFRQVPIPAFATPAWDEDGTDNPILKGQCGADADMDNQMIVLDMQSRCEYDFFQARKEDGSWVASWANGISMDSKGIYEQGFSSRGSGFSTLAGLIWPDELAKGKISHAMGFSYAYARAGGPVAPASESDGLSKETWALPEGARLRLDPAISLDDYPLTPSERVIAEAMQRYGIILFDDGSSGVSLEAVDPDSVQGNPYANLLPEGDFPSLKNIPLAHLQLLKLPAQDPDFDENNKLVNGPCARFE